MTESDPAPRLNREKVVNKAKQQARSLIPWLDDFECPRCGQPCETDHAHDPQLAAFYGESNGKRPTWYCGECGMHYRREGESGMSFSPFRD